MIGRIVGLAFATARDFVARCLVRMKVSPNAVTVAGVLLTVGAGVCYAVGVDAGLGWSLKTAAPANAYLLLAGALLVLACACDMLDGAVARIGNRKTQFGGFLDSTLDRFSDFAVYAGIAVGYCLRDPPNVTFALLAMLAFFSAFMISYTRARAENLIPSCSVGYWQRGERSAAILIATVAYNVPGLVVQQAALPLLTVLRRVLYTRAVLAGKPRVTDPRQGRWWLKVRLWRWPRMTIPYDLVTAINVAWLIFGRIPPADLIGRLIGR